MVADGGDVIRNVITPIDLVVYGMADERMEALLHPELWPALPGTDLSTEELPDALTYVDLRYDIVDDYMSFQPSIEVARGCGMGCFFCDERRELLSRLRAPESLVQSVRCTVDSYGTDRITPYFEASLFRPSLMWSLKSLRSFRERYPRLDGAAAREQTH